MDGSRSIPELTHALRRGGKRIDEAVLRRAVARLHRLGIVEEAPTERPRGISASEWARYGPNLDFFSLVSLGTPLSAQRIQGRLKASRVTILGIGAIGGATAMSLAAAGVGHLRLIDPDRVETSNLNRQLLYRTSDVGRPKVVAARQRLGELNPHVVIATGRNRVRRPAEIGPLLDGCDLFILGADQPHEILLWANDAAVRRGTPWLENSYGGPRCAVALFVPGRTPCLRCQQHFLERQHRAHGTERGTLMFPRFGTNDVIAPTASIAAHFGALQALYFLAGLPTAAEGRLIHLNLWRPQDVRTYRPPFWAACPACGTSTDARRHADASAAGQDKRRARRGRTSRARTRR